MHRCVRSKISLIAHVSLTALCGLALSMAGAHAAGVSKTLRVTVNETLLQGYTATPPRGWSQTIQYATASAATEATQQVAALVSQSRISALSAVLPKSAAITMVSLATGVTARKFNLPVAAQVVRADCTFPVGAAFTGCQNAFYSVAADLALPGRLIVTALKPTFDPLTQTSGTKMFVYVLDPAATLAGDQWTLISQSQTIPGLPSSVGTRSPAQRLYVFERASPTTTDIFEVANK